LGSVSLEKVIEINPLCDTDEEDVRGQARIIRLEMTLNINLINFSSYSLGWAHVKDLKIDPQFIKNLPKNLEADQTSSNI